MSHPSDGSMLLLGHTKQDEMSQSLREDISEISNITQKTFQNVIKEAQILLGNPEASPEDRQKMIDRLETLSQSAQKATQSLKDFDKADSLETKALVEGVENTDPASRETNIDGWVKDATLYYQNSRNNMLDAAEVAAQDPALAAPKTSFLQKAATAALGLEVLIQRANAIPDRVAEIIVEGSLKRLQQMNTGLQDWKNKTQDTYNDLKEQSKKLMTSAVDHTGAVVDVVLNQSEGVLTKTGIAVHSRIFEPLKRFLVDKAAPAIKNAALGVVDNLHDHVRQISTDYSQSLARRRSNHLDIEPTEPTIGPKNR